MRAFAVALAMQLAVMILVAGCTAPQAPATSVLIFRGTLTYAERIALPPGSRAVIELRDESVPTMPVVAEQRMDLKAAQVPILFELTVDIAQLTAGHRYALRAAVMSGGRVTWASAPMQVEPSKPVVALGAVRLTPYQALAFSSVFYCGDLRLEVGFADRAMRMRVLNQDLDLHQVVAASGARYEAINDATTTFWNKGNRGTLVIRGREYPECVEGQSTLPLRAGGNEPGWRLEIAPSGMTLIADSGATRIETPPAVLSRIGDGMRYSANSGAIELTVDVMDRVCRDSMTGMPHPYTVSVSGGGRILHGCGGEPAALLRGGEWVVEDLNGGGIIDRSRVTVRFGDGGVVSGRASCNTYAGRYALSGEGLSIVEAVAMQRACAPSLMAQEERFLATFLDVQSFDFTDDGALVLRAHGSRSIKARRGG